MSPKTAFITGGNGITGQALLEHFVKDTSEAEWARIVVTSESELRTTIKESRITFIALDLTQDPGALIELMQEPCGGVTHAYFSSYVHTDDLAESNAANKAVFENFLLALTCVAPNLQNCCLQTGAEYYGSHLVPVPTPCREDEARRGDPEHNFYFSQEDFLTELQRNHGWTWNVIRPGTIIGQTVKPNGMNDALTCALYFLITKELAQEARMPTNQRYWNATETASDIALLARFTVWVSTNRECANEAFNFVNGDHFTWRYMWPRLAEWFGAYATSDQHFKKSEPEIGQLQQEFSLVEWAMDKRPVWDSLCDRMGVPEAKDAFGAGTFASQDRTFMRSWSSSLSMNKARKFGWTGSVDTFDSLTDAFAKFKELRMIP